MPKLTIDKTAALCLLYQCSIEELAQAVTESMAQGMGRLLSIGIGRLSYPASF
jgi:hypothetical protein